MVKTNTGCAGTNTVFRSSGVTKSCDAEASNRNPHGSKSQRDDCEPVSACSPHKAPPISAIDESGIATLRVGKNLRPFYVHTNLLTRHSRFFQRILAPDSRFREAQTKTIDLPEATEDAVKLATRWWYFGQLIQDQYEFAPCTLIDTWLFGAMYLDLELCNAAITALHSMIFVQDLEAADVRHIWAKTRTDAPLRAFTVEAFYIAMEMDVLERAQQASEDGNDVESDDALPRAFVLALCRRSEAAARPDKFAWKALWRGLDLSPFFMREEKSENAPGDRMDESH